MHARRNRVFITIGAISAISFALVGCAGDEPTPSDTPAAENATTAAPTQEPTSEPTTDTTVETGDVQGTADYMVFGDPDATNSIDVYSDYLCPHCADFALQLQPQIIEEFATEGSDVKFVVHDFRVIDPAASGVVAIAARAAGEQGKFTEMQEVLMERQDELHDLFRQGNVNADTLTEFAEAAGVPDLDQFAADMASPEMQQAVVADEDSGRDLGVAGPPSVVVNGEEVADLSLDGIREALEK